MQNIWSFRKKLHDFTENFGFEKLGVWMEMEQSL
jgi:hypothetical protein